MTISSINAYSPAASMQATGRLDRDNDGDNDAGKSAASEAAESSRGPATRVTLSPAAQALMNAQKA